MLPEDLQSQLTSFSIDGFAKKHFAERKSGFFSRKTISVSQLTSWQRTPLDAPLLPIDRKFTSEALAAFRTIQRIMGDRDRSAAISAKGAADMACPEDWITDPFSVLHEPWSNAVAEDARSLVTTGIKTGALRDEIYLQLLKQLTRNPSMHSMLRGWQLLQVLTTSFAPVGVLLAFVDISLG